MQSSKTLTDTDPVELTSSHTNNVQITSSLITDITYNSFFNVTANQPSFPPPTATRDAGANTWVISIDCGRKNSTTAAAAFSKAVIGSDQNDNAASHMYAPLPYGGGAPEELNFCFGMTVTFSIGNTTVTTQLYFGQGSAGSNNNWWMGGNGVINEGGTVDQDPLLVLVNGGNIVKILELSGSTSSFTLR